MNDIRSYCLRRALEGASHGQIAKELGVSRNTVSGQIKRGRCQLERQAEERPIDVAAAPPSPAMLRLAQFDPVVARAALARTALAA